MDVIKKIQRDERNDLSKVLSSLEGRRFIWRILSQAGIYKDMPVENPQLMARQAGKRALGLWLLQLVGDCDNEKLFQMMNEASLREKELEHLAKKHDLDEAEKSDVKSGHRFI